jgi:hypothetical protein
MYKIIQNNKIIDVVKNPLFVRFLASGNIAITDKTSAQGIAGSDNETLYSFKPISRKNVSVAAIEEITEKEFNRLQSLLNSGKEICADESILAQAKQDTLKRLSNLCKNAITAGFYIILSDKQLYNFKLTAEDQLNLLNIENQFNAGANSFVYHATDLPCQVFSRIDMNLILKAYRKHILYHTTYFNAAKHYINSLIDIEKVNNFTYGLDVSNTIADPTIRQILKRGGTIR